MPGLLRRDLRNAADNLRSLRAELARKDTPFIRGRIELCRQEIDELLDQMLQEDRHA